jgi:hypothetical protein
MIDRRRADRRPPPDNRLSSRLSSRRPPGNRLSSRLSSTTGLNHSPFLPRRQRGRQTEAKDAKYQTALGKFCALILKIKRGMDFSVGVRGWCYILERYGLFKGDFADAERLINKCRKDGNLPLDICAEDDSRETIGLEEINPEDDPELEADNLIHHLLHYAHEDYKPISFWEGLNIYIEVAVEKLDLRNLFEPVCRELHVPITNFKGWSDINSRAAMARRFKKHEAAGRLCILLLCGDHDPGGLHITDWMQKNFYDLRDAYSDAEGPIDWTPEKLKIIRFGLNKDFIDANSLTWIDNLETSSGKQLDDPNHADHKKEYVQDYLREFGARKCEANALVVVPEMGRQLVRDAIMQHLPPHTLVQYRNKLERQQRLLQKRIRERLGEEE